MLTIAIQKKGRLSGDILQLLKDTGITFSHDVQTQLKTSAINFPIQILLLRDDDIPDCVSRGVADAGIVGENTCLEKQKPVRILEKLGIARCRLSIALPEKKDYNGIRDLKDLTIATSYPVILEKYLAEKGLNVSI